VFGVLLGFLQRLHIAAKLARKLQTRSRLRRNLPLLATERQGLRSTATPVSLSELARPDPQLLNARRRAASRPSANFAPIAEALSPHSSEVPREPTSISNLLDLEDSRITLTGASLIRSSITHVRMAVKSGNVISTFFDTGCSLQNKK
jgi:hypothetical protein